MRYGQCVMSLIVLVPQSTQKHMHKTMTAAMKRDHRQRLTALASALINVQLKQCPTTYSMCSEKELSCVSNVCSTSSRASCIQLS